MLIGNIQDNRSYIQVGSHNDQEVRPIGEFRLEKLGVFHRLFWRVYRARTYNHEDAVITTCHDSGGIVAGRCNSFLRASRRNDLMAKKSWLDKRIVLG